MLEAMLNFTFNDNELIDHNSNYNQIQKIRLFAQCYKNSVFLLNFINYSNIFL